MPLNYTAQPREDDMEVTWQSCYYDGWSVVANAHLAETAVPLRNHF